MKVARHPILSNTAHARLLPPSWMALYELTKLPEEELVAYLNDGTIHPKMERKDVMNIRHKLSDNDRARIEKAIKADPHANQREAAKQLGIARSTYQRARKRMIEEGEIAPDTNTRDQEIAAAIEQLVKATKG